MRWTDDWLSQEVGKFESYGGGDLIKFRIMTWWRMRDERVLPWRREPKWVALQLWYTKTTARLERRMENELQYPPKEREKESGCRPKFLRKMSKNVQRHNGFRGTHRENHSRRGLSWAIVWDWIKIVRKIRKSRERISFSVSVFLFLIFNKFCLSFLFGRKWSGQSRRRWRGRSSRTPALDYFVFHFSWTFWSDDTRKKRQHTFLFLFFFCFFLYTCGSAWWRAFCCLFIHCQL